jgi:cytochrome P450
VRIPKGQEVRFDLLGAHINQDEWKNPLEFIPERFDPDSEFYKKQSEDKQRSPLAHVPFSVGKRMCVGNSYAMLEMKVALVYMLTHMEFEADKDILEKEGVGYAIGSEIKFHFTVTKIKH